MGELPGGVRDRAPAGQKRGRFPKQLATTANFRESGIAYSSKGGHAPEEQQEYFREKIPRDRQIFFASGRVGH